MNNRKSNWFWPALLPAVFFVISVSPARSADNRFHPIHTELDRQKAVRFDPSYYYDRDIETAELCRNLTQTWFSAGINTIYFKTYDPVHGAVYRTQYAHTIQTDYGRLDLLKAMLKAAAPYDMKVIAWIPAFQHKQAWEAHPEWRVKTLDGNDYKPSPDSYFLCQRDSAFQVWWLGFIADLLLNYPELEGIDLAEPVVSWHQDEGCYCDFCLRAREDRKVSAEGVDRYLVRSGPLTGLLIRSIRAAQERGKRAVVTTVASAHADGRLFSPDEQRAMTGFDLNGLLDSADSPDLINVELIWQQWAHLHGDYKTFSPRWTFHATREVLRQVDLRVPVVIHVELTAFGGRMMNDEQVVETIQTAWDGGAWGVDFYDSHQADERGIWPLVASALSYNPLKKVWVVYDEGGENDARQLATLLRHFNTHVDQVVLNETFIPPGASRTDMVFYIGLKQRAKLPLDFIRFMTDYRGVICWLNYNIQLMPPEFLKRLGISFEGVSNEVSAEIHFRGFRLPKEDPALNYIGPENGSCRVLATARVDTLEFPYALYSRQFWYFADLPTNYVQEGGRHIVFAELLHEILREDHREKKTALVRIEDVHPLSNPDDIRAVANYLGSRKVPFSLGLTPFYLDPEQNVTVSISDRPELVKALHHAVKKGAALLLHGCTHQYRGETTVDYEFWDGLTDTPVFQDSRGYVKERINRALSECSKNGLFPLAWETPHYAASQLDYGVINEHFSTCYERRQTMDITGTDQLLPFFIPQSEGYPQMIPENLGYISLDNPDPRNMLQYAANNRIIRDGFASFFFHPFVPLDALKTLIRGIREMGYDFSDIRTLSHRVISDAGAFATGEGRVTVNLEDQYLEAFCVTPRGRYKNRIVSDERVSSRITREVDCPPLHIAVFRPLAVERSRGLFSFLGRPVRSIRKLWETSDLHPAVPSAEVLILVHDAAEGRLRLDQESCYSSFRTLGIPVRRLRAADFFEIPQGVNLLVIPRAADRYLTEQQAVIIIDAVARGMNLIFEKQSIISEKLGFTVTGDSLVVEEVVDEYYPRVPIQWKEPGYYQTFDMPMEYITYYSDKTTGNSLVAGGSYGEGRFLYLATLLDPLTGKGYARYPYFIDLIQRHFNLWPLFRFEKAHVYFEPGDRENTSIEDLVQMWKKSGFHVIYAAGWHVYPEWSYDYKRLIELAHQNAMLVYLWLELPHVNQKFWDEHPSWREKTATGEDAIVDWRRLMALTDDSCRQAVLDEVSGMIQAYDWDGVNLAELYFESPLGPSRPDQLTPMHVSVRRRFGREHGYDPIDIFNENSPHYWRRSSGTWDRFERFRQDLVVELHEIFLRHIESNIEKKDRDMEIVVTLVDNLIAVQTGRYTGTDTRRLIPLQNQVPFTLQIEDPLELWHMGPGRYERLHSIYRELTDGTLIFDVNVVPIREHAMTPAPTHQPTGMELYQSMSACRQDSNLLALYSESSIYEVDHPYIAHVLAGNVRGRLQSDYWNVSTPHPVVINLDADRHHDLRVNEALWPAYFNGRMLLPPGEHRVQTVPFVQNIVNSLKSNSRLVDMSGDLLGCRMLGRGLEFRYRSSTVNHVIINEKPWKVWLDETVYPEASEAGMNGYRLALPSGTHSVRVITRTQGSFSLKNFSVIISALIITLSVGSGFLLVLLYGVRFFRRRSNRSL